MVVEGADPALAEEIASLPYDAETEDDILYLTLTGKAGEV